MMENRGSSRLLLIDAQSSILDLRCWLMAPETFPRKTDTRLDDWWAGDRSLLESHCNKGRKENGRPSWVWKSREKAIGWMISESRWITRLDPACPVGQGIELADSQKGADVKHFMSGDPSPPANWNWRTVANSSRKTHTLTLLNRHVAEWSAKVYCPIFLLWDAPLC